jgi:hypothetical protein
MIKLEVLIIRFWFCFIQIDSTLKRRDPDPVHFEKQDTDPVKNLLDLQGGAAVLDQRSITQPKHNIKILYFLRVKYGMSPSLSWLWSGCVCIRTRTRMG